MTTHRCSSGRLTDRLARTMAWIVAAVVCCSGAAAQAKSRPPLPTPESRGSSAATHHDAGARLFEAGQFHEAISEFRKAYELEARPEFLFHIGRAYDRLGRSDSALHFFRRFLSTDPPNSPQRAEAEAAVASAAAPTTISPSAETAPSGDNALMPVSSLRQRPAAALEPPITHRWWFWAALGAVTVAGVALSVATMKDDGVAPPVTDLGHKRLQ